MYISARRREHADTSVDNHLIQLWFWSTSTSGVLRTRKGPCVLGLLKTDRLGCSEPKSRSSHIGAGVN